MPGLCRAVTRAVIAEQGFSLNPARYVGRAASEPDALSMAERLTPLQEQLEILTAEGHRLEDKVAANIEQLLEDG